MSVVTSPSKEGLISFGKLSKRSTLVISLLSYPVFLSSDKWFGRRDSGYTLIAEARKVN